MVGLADCEPSFFISFLLNTIGSGAVLCLVYQRKGKYRLTSGNFTPPKTKKRTNNKRWQKRRRTSCRKMQTTTRYHHIERKFTQIQQHHDVRNQKESSDITYKRKTVPTTPTTADVRQTSLITATEQLLTKLKARLLVPERDLESISLAVCRGLQECSLLSNDRQQPADGMVIQAAAGGGKTTLLNAFLEHYCHGPNRCLYVSGRDVNGRDR